MYLSVMVEQRSRTRHFPDYHLGASEESSGPRLSLRNCKLCRLLSLQLPPEAISVLGIEISPWQVADMEFRRCRRLLRCLELEAREVDCIS
mmetsp:Transcript_32539/g.78969  ORF Transcript_32539/g.78969 Transcript_32539/m.78969 type:complete len:91 (+) Transcript_32539:18-290(+)